jgi:hypothetical protein
MPGELEGRELGRGGVGGVAVGVVTDLVDDAAAGNDQPDGRILRVAQERGGCALVVAREVEVIQPLQSQQIVLVPERSNS